MGEAKFTKGPYFAKEVTAVCGMYSVMLGDNGFNESGDYMQIHLCESDSNAEHVANLFAAAPEMYAMLEKVLVEYKEMLGMSPEINEIEQLLAKARGEACHN